MQAVVDVLKNFRKFDGKQDWWILLLVNLLAFFMESMNYIFQRIIWNFQVSWSAVISGQCSLYFIGFPLLCSYRDVFTYIPLKYIWGNFFKYSEWLKQVWIIINGL